MTGWLEAWKCFVACLFFEESQQPTCPHSRHIRRCTHESPVFTQSSQASLLVPVNLIWLRCWHPCGISPSFCEAPVFYAVLAENSRAFSRVWRSQFASFAPASYVL